MGMKAPEFNATGSVRRWEISNLGNEPFGALGHDLALGLTGSKVLNTNDYTLGPGGGDTILIADVDTEDRSNLDVVGIKAGIAEKGRTVEGKLGAFQLGVEGEGKLSP
ncbi:hypothetical protein M0R45_029800 [Rubus argutus]|uniref:Uncharacterized protein n=1 Tax=Rubus argutus TaxID=59490 RepID=A0AAW1WC81_RUBAR